MDAMPFVSMIRRWGWLALIPVAITTAVALPGLLSRGPASGGFSMSLTYSASQQFEAIPRTEGDYQDIWLSSELTVNAFTEWIRGSRFRDEVAAAAERAGSPIDVAALGLAADNARSVGRIDMSYPTQAGMAAAGAAAIEVLGTRSADYFAQLGGQPAQVTILGQTPATAAPPPLGDRFTPLLRIGIGVVAGLLLMAAAYYLDPLLRGRAELAEAGLRMLGTIPRQ